MLGRLLSIRADERVAAWTAFAFLTALVASHSVLETARDALFLARLPATRLPLVYLGIAALSLIASRVQARGALAIALPRALACGRGRPRSGRSGCGGCCRARRAALPRS